MGGNPLNDALKALFASTKALIDEMMKRQGRCVARFLPIRPQVERQSGQHGTYGLVSLWFYDGQGGVTCLN